MTPHNSKEKETRGGIGAYLGLPEKPTWQIQLTQA